MADYNGSIEIDDPFIVGVDAIAREFGLKPKQVYNLSHLRAKGKSQFPVWNEPGLGLVTTRKKARAYKEAPPALAKTG